MSRAKRPADDTALAEALVARLTARSGSSMLPQVGYRGDGELRAGDLILDVTVNIRRVVTWDLKRDCTDLAMRLLDEPGREYVVLGCCGATTTKKSRWGNSACSKSITHAVVLSPGAGCERPGHYGPLQPRVTWTCAVHAQGYRGDHVLAAVELPKRALQVTRVQARRRQDERDALRWKSEQVTEWALWWTREAKKPNDDLTRARQAREKGGR